MKLIQKGTKVTGTYEQGHGKLEGTVIKNKLVGTWIETESSKSGLFQFTLSPEDKSLQLFWRHNTTSPWIADQLAVKITSGYL